MEILIIILIVISIFLGVSILIKIKKVNESDIALKLSKIETEIIKEIGDFKLDY